MQKYLVFRSGPGVKSVLDVRISFTLRLSKGFHLKAQSSVIQHCCVLQITFGLAERCHLLPPALSLRFVLWWFQKKSFYELVQHTDLFCAHSSIWHPAFLDSIYLVLLEMAGTSPSGCRVLNKRQEEHGGQLMVEVCSCSRGRQIQTTPVLLSG